MDPEPLHHARAVNLHRADANPEIGGDQLVAPASQQSLEDVVLAGTQCCYAPHCVGDFVTGVGSAFLV
jgi:hypothetical protein